MITLYLWDEFGISAGSIEADPRDAMPPRSTPKPPPEVTAQQAAQWTGSGWRVLESKPIIAPKPEFTPTDIAARRWQAETSGVLVDGITLATDRDSQSLITGAVVSAMRDPEYICRWKTASGFVELDANKLIFVADVVRAHVQACFDREAELLNELLNGELTSEMLEEGWPGGDAVY